MTDYETELKNKGVTAFVPTGVSMWPFIKSDENSCVIVKKDGRLSLYDVALYKRESGVYVLHRVTEIKENGYVFTGDSQYYSEFIDEQSVLGVLDGFYKGKKYIKSTDKKYLKKVKSWYKHKLIRKIRIKCFWLFNKRKKENV